MIADAVTWFIGLGSVVFIPIIIIILGLIVRVKPSKAIIAGITVGIGFIGLNMVTGFLQEVLGPAIKLMVKNYGLTLSIMDLGSGTAGPLSFSTTLGVLIIPVAFILNLILVLPALIGVMVWGITGNYVYGAIAMIPGFLLQLLLADLSQPLLSKFFNFPGIAITHLMALSGMVLAVPLNWLFDRIPGLKDLDVDPETIQEKFGLIGDPIIIGFVIGVVIGLLAGYDFGGFMTLGVQMAAVLKILPKMVGMFMEGLTPIAEGTQEFCKKYLHGKVVNIGMDAALTVGNSAVMATALLLIPVTLFISVVLPGNKILPFGDLPTLVFALSCMVAAFKGNILRSVIGCGIYSASMLYLATWLAPALTKAYQLAQYSVGSSGLVSYVSAGLWPNALMVFIGQVFSLPGILIITVVILGLLFYVNKIKKFNA